MMNLEKLMMGEITLTVAEHTGMDIQKFKNLLTNFGFAHAKLVILDGNGIEHEMEVGEILGSDIRAYDPVDSFEIQHESELLPN